MHDIPECKILRASYLCRHNSLVVVYYLCGCTFNICINFITVLKSPLKRHIKTIVLKKQSVTNFLTTFLAL